MRSTTSHAMIAAFCAAACATAAPAAAQPRPPAPRARLGDPLRGLTAEERANFELGRDAFAEQEDVEDGLGPVFNDVSCEKCHNVPATGGGSERLVTRFGTRTNGAFDPLAEWGGSLIQENGIGPLDSCEYAGETVPAAATISAHRRTTPLFGLGLVDAVPDERFRQLAARQRAVSPDTAGRPNVVTDVATGAAVVGKFGWKAQVPSLAQFSADAYLNEMGITSPLFPQENCPQGDCAALACDPVADPEDDGEDVELFDDFMSFLAAPVAVTRDRDAASGESTFVGIGCADCHAQTLRTGASPTRALDRVAFHPYSDFLLHDMGALGDGIAQGAATGREMRTAPLWGLHAVTKYLHDGRATTIEGAILAHDGQGRKARERFSKLSPPRRAQLLAFLRGL
jgi:CxxC motif-containing protein (DUF1111 family)